MTVTSAVNRISFTGNGSTTLFAFPGKFFANTDLKVVRKTIASGAEAVLVLNTDYTVSGAGNPTGGSVTMASAPSALETITIYADPPTTQERVLALNAPFPPQEIEMGLDKLTLLVRRAIDMASRSIRVSEGTESFDPVLPTDIEPFRLLMVAEDGLSLAAGPTPQELSDAAEGVIISQESADDAAASALAAAASQDAASDYAVEADESATAAAVSAAAALASENAADVSAGTAEYNADLAAKYALLIGAGVPSNGLGVDDNKYVDSISGSFYAKEFGSWVLKVTLTGSGGVATFNGRSGAVSPQAGDYTKADVGLGNVDNTSDTNKPVSTATQTALDALAATITGDVTGPASSVDSEVALFSGTGGKTLKRSTVTGYMKAASGVPSAVTTIPIADGGTGQTSKTPAFDALSPMTTAGDTIIGGVSGSATRLPVGANGEVYTVVSGVPAWAAAGGGGGTAEATGFVKDFLGSTAPTGYVFASGRTIGNATSGGTERANADTSDLFTLLWTDYSNSILQIQTSAGAGTTRGASAAADYAANKRMPLPDLRGVGTIGKDNMGGSAANRVTTAGSGIDGVTLGANGGAQNVTLTSAEMPVHTHIQNAHNHTITDPGHVHAMSNVANTANLSGATNTIRSTGVANTASATTGITVDNATPTNQNAGSGGAHNNMPPSFVVNKVIKL